MARISYYFPEEIWDQILLNLPSKTLCRFLSECKPWYRLITSQAFISSHLNQNICTERNTHTILRVVHGHDDKEDFLLYPHLQTNNVGISKSVGVPSFIPKLPFKMYSIFNTILGSCNGLICMIGRNFTIILFNRSINKFVKLPPPPSREIPYKSHAFGFGVNLLNGDFKVIRVYEEDFSSLSMAEVYSLKAGKWVDINGISLKFHHLSFSNHVYVNGRSHWIGRIVDNYQCSLISFDMSDEVFRKVSAPPQFDIGYGVPNLVTMTLKGKECLGIVINKERSADRHLLIWVMEEYGISQSWTNIYTIRQEVIMRTMGSLRFIGFTKSGNILMKQGSDGLICYDPLTELVSNFDTLGVEKKGGCGWHVEKYYMESLILLTRHPSIIS